MQQAPRTLANGSMPIRILHVVHGLPCGGLENGVVNLLNHLPLTEFQQAVACLDQRGEMADRIVHDVSLWVLNRRRHDLALSWRLSRVIRKWRPDVVHCRNWNTWLDTVAAHRLANRQGQLVWSFHGFPGTDQVPLRRRVASRWLARMSDHMFAVCRDSADRYAGRTGIRPERFSVIYNGVDTTRFTPVADCAAIRMELGLPRDEVLALTTASLTSVKDHAGLIEAAAPVLQERPTGLRFVFVGNGPLRPDLERRIEALGFSDRFLLMGHSNRVPDLMRAVDFFILPSTLEGMSNAILEAMASGLPVIARRVGGNSELVVNGATGVLAESGDSAGLSAAIARLADDGNSRAALGRAARHRAEDVFSLDAMVTSYADFYRRIASHA
jgi:sugar transferase (PEP-CTERM/EpsH1 system associated)